MEAGGIGEADGVEPAHGAHLGIAGAGQQAGDDALIGAGGGVVEEGAVFGFGGRQAGEVQGDAAEQGAAVGFGRRVEAGGGEAVADEGVYRIGAGRVGGGGGRHGRAFDGLVGPVALVDGAFGHPAAEGVLLVLGELLVGVDGGHDAAGVGGEDALDDGAAVGVAGDDGGATGFSGPNGLFAQVQAEAGHAGAYVGAMTPEAGVGHDGADVAIEPDGRLGGVGNAGDKEAKGSQRTEYNHSVVYRIALWEGCSQG